MTNENESGEGVENTPPITPEALPDAPKSKVKGMLHELEMFALQRSTKQGLDLSNFNTSQTDKLLEILSKNEDNAIKYHQKRLDAAKEVELKRISATTVSQINVRIALIGTLIVVPLITILILLFKDSYFVPWLTFLTGLAGGFGLSKASKALTKEPPKNSLAEDDSED